MNANKGTVRYLVETGLIAALYAALTYLCSFFGLAYGSVQFRISEALTLLPVLTPAAIPGLTIGCLLANLGSIFGLVDIICGTLATFLAALCTRLTRQIRIKGWPVLSALCPVIFNALIIGIEISWFLPEGLTWTGFLASAAGVGLGELVICLGLGLPLIRFLEKTSLLK